MNDYNGKDDEESIGKCLSKEFKKSLEGLASAAALGVLAAGGIVSAKYLGDAVLSSPQRTPDGQWVSRYSNGATIVEKTNESGLGHTRLIDSNSDGRVDLKYRVALPRPGCFGYFPVDNRDQEIFERVTKR